MCVWRVVVCLCVVLVKLPNVSVKLNINSRKLACNSTVKCTVPKVSNYWLSKKDTFTFCRLDANDWVG